ncbi:response regulator [Hoeflea ulvae]|uniref:Response regulator transcription factor n=1 Tax=Hoeflea ulvae TaxID=2983764 RepID=A0ABT3YH57_9HYPH|nr:response regulator transcription factor [Hoeflea ulvae]MCY0095129.1 response regulator transcription factor [Hoeflea ulvae]
MPPGEDIRILLVDDHMVVRKGLLHVLDTVDGFSVVAEAENGEEALYLCQKLKPDVVIMDVKMEGVGGIEATRLIARHHPATRIIGLSTFASKDVAADMLAAGAHGYLLKDVSATELVHSVRLIHKGETLPLPELGTQSEVIPAVPQIHDRSEPSVKMGEQQHKVLALMTKGFTNPEIASYLGMSQPTARYHVSAILQKLDVSNRSEAVALAIRTGLIDADDF